MSNNSHVKKITPAEIAAMRSKISEGLAAEDAQEKIRLEKAAAKKEADALRRKQAQAERHEQKKAAQNSTPTSTPDKNPTLKNSPPQSITDGDSQGHSDLTPDRVPIQYQNSDMHNFVMQCIRCKDKGAGVLFSMLFRNRFVYVPEFGEWFFYAKTFWERVHPHALDAAVERVVEKYEGVLDVEMSRLSAAREDEDKIQIAKCEAIVKRINHGIDNLHTPSGVSGCLRFALGNDEPLVVQSADLDNNPMQLACNNGLVDLRTGKFSPCKPSDYVTQTSPYDWVSIDAPAPTFRAMVHEILGEDEAVSRYFQKIIGYAFAGRVTEKILVVMYGEDGDSGKTTFFELLKKITAQASSLPVELLLDSGQPLNPNSPTPAMMALKGQRVMWASEPGEGRKFSIDRVKLLTGGDSLKARSPWDKAETEFDPSHTLFLITNHKMHSRASDQAFWSRIKLIDCPFSFVAKPDPNNPKQRQRRENIQDEILASEASGVLAYIVEGYQMYAAEGLETPARVVDETKKYRREEDLLAEFVETCLTPLPNNNIQATQLYEVFKRWYEDFYSKKVPSLTIFGKMAQGHLKKDRIGGKIFYLNIMLQEDAQYKYGPK